MDEILEYQKESFGIDNFLENTKVYIDRIGDLNLDVNTWYKDLLSGDITSILKSIDLSKIFLSEFKGVLSIVTSIVIVIIINSILKTIIESLNSSTASKSLAFIQYLIIANIIINSFIPIVELTKISIENLNGFINLLLPILLVFMVTTGNLVSKSVIESSIILMINFTSNFINEFVIPVILISFVISIVSNITSKIRLDKVSKLLKSFTVWGLGIILTFFTTVLSLETNITGSVDELASKTTKAAVQNLIPVVGKIMGDTVETVMGSVSVLSNIVGTFGIIIIALIVLIPIIRILIFYFMFKIVGAVSEACSDKEIINLLESVSDSYKIMLGMIFTVSILFIIGITITLKIICMSSG